MAGERANLLAFGWVHYSVNESLVLKLDKLIETAVKERCRLKEKRRRTCFCDHFLLPTHRERGLALTLASQQQLLLKEASLGQTIMSSAYNQGSDIADLHRGISLRAKASIEIGGCLAIC